MRVSSASAAAATLLRQIDLEPEHDGVHHDGDANDLKSSE